jgi:hypothetical protein
MTATSYRHRCESAWSVCYLSLITNGIRQAGLCTSYGIGWVCWHIQCCWVSLALVRPQWYWLDWNMLQVIMITRLYAMYQRSRKILIFLIVTFLPFDIFNVVTLGAIMITTNASGGMLNCGWQKRTWDSLMNTRGTHTLRHVSMLGWLRGRYSTSGFHCLDTHHCVGGPHTISRSLDCCQTFPWTPTKFDRRDNTQLFHGVDRNSYALLCEVSSHCKHGPRFC